MSRAHDEAPSVDELLKEIEGLREREAYYKSIIESADKGIWVINDEYKTVYINYRMAEMLGTTIDEAMGGTVWKFLDDESWPVFMEILSRCQEGRMEQFDIKFRRMDGTELWALAGLVPFFDRQGFRIGISGTFADITRRKRMETELKATRDNLVKAQHVGRMGSWVRDLKTDMIESSGEMGNILGAKAVPTTVEEVIEMLYPPDERERMKRISQEAIEKGGSYKTDVRMVRPDGKEIYCHLEAEVVKDSLGRPVKIVGILQDITERKKAELALEDARAQSEFFIDLISHDIGNMNQAILGYLELALERLAPSEKDADLLAKPMEIIKDSSRLIHDVRKLRSVVSGRMSMEKLDAGEVLSRAVTEFSRGEGKDTRVNYRPQKGCIVMAGELLYDALSTILFNFLRHSRGRLTMDIGISEVREDGRSYCRISFEDHGPGISDKMKKELMGDVRDVSDIEVRRGLELRFVKTIIDSYHGRIWMEDRVPGDYAKGIRVVIMLPGA
jgi:PAS domain S-box-containing protein